MRHYLLFCGAMGRLSTQVGPVPISVSGLRGQSHFCGVLPQKSGQSPGFSTAGRAGHGRSMVVASDPLTDDSPDRSFHAQSGRNRAATSRSSRSSAQLALQVLPADDAIDEAVFQQEFARLKALGQLNADRGLDGARPGKADQGAWARRKPRRPARRSWPPRRPWSGS